MSPGLEIWSMTLLITIARVYCTKVEYTPVVAVDGLKIKGLKEDGFAKYLGVPYGVIEKGNPFGSSKPHPGSSDVFEATESKKCPQLENKVVVGTLDCLTVDIYVPTIGNEQDLFPVMVWIRGDYEPVRTGSDSGSPYNLLRHDVIVVAINYRVDIYGFLCLDIPYAPGNIGLVDQIMALRWINKNIEVFHGNPKKITVFGGGLGGDYISLHLFSSSEKLFQRAIIQSGSALSPIWAKKPSRNKSFLKLVSELGYNTSDINAAFAYLSTIGHDAHKILKNENIKDVGTNPCIQKKFKGYESFISEHPSNIVSSKAGTTPVIIGYNDNEAAVWVNLIPDETIPLYTFGDILKFENLKNHLDAEEDFRHFYIGDEEITEKVKQALTNFVADFYYGVPNQRMVNQLLQNKATTVYRYVFSYSGDRNLMKKKYKLNSVGATHGDELGYLLNYNKLGGKPTPQDQIMIDRMTTIWTNFAKFGNPTPKKTDLLPNLWKLTTKEYHQYLDINSQLSMKDMPTHKRMAFWSLFYKLYGDTK